MKFIITLAAILISWTLDAQKHTDRSNLDLDVSQYEMVHIYNTGGAVNVVASNQRTASIDVERTLKARNNKKLERAKTEIYIDTTAVDGELFVYINSPYKMLKGDSHDKYLYYTSRDDGHFNRNNWRDVGVEYRFDLNIKIPASTNLVVSTHRGDLTVDGLKGNLYALNHHNDVTLKNVHYVHYAHSHHGDVEVAFTGQPGNDIAFDTHHGDIKVSFPNMPSAEIEFDSHHGSFYTDFDWTPAQPKLEKVNSRSKKRTKYRVGKRTRVEMGNGGQKLTFDTHHGDMYILKI